MKLTKMELEIIEEYLLLTVCPYSYLSDDYIKAKQLLKKIKRELNKTKQ